MQIKAPPDTLSPRDRFNDDGHRRGRHGRELAEAKLHGHQALRGVLCCGGTSAPVCGVGGGRLPVSEQSAGRVKPPGASRWVRKAHAGQLGSFRSAGPGGGGWGRAQDSAFLIQPEGDHTWLEDGSEACHPW